MLFSRPIRSRLLVTAAVLCTALSVWVAGSLENRAADRVLTQSQAAEHMLEGMLDQETGLRGFALTGDRRFLQPYLRGHRLLQQAVRSARSAARGRPSALRLIALQEGIAAGWRTLAERRIRIIARRGPGARIGDALLRKEQVDRFRAVNATYQGHIAKWNRDERRHATELSIFVVLLASALFGSMAYVFVSRGARAERAREASERRFRATQGEFIETLQVARSEDEANGLLKLHLERSIAGSEVTILNRNNSADRLASATPLAEGSRLAQALRGGAKPSSCLAVRLGVPYDRAPVDEPLLGCELCSEGSCASTCKPLLVSGEVIGSVLVQHERALADEDRRRLAESVGLAAPVLANLRNLALAEQRAATDALTGLPNKRSVDDTLKRMVAQAGRSASPLAAVLLDLDHFKAINDTFGHDRGDEVLAAVAATMTDTVRASDFVGRFGGEEFILLLPATDRAGAVQVSEKLRAALADIEVPGVTRRVTASLGVAVLPVDAVDAEQLLRLADRALYTAKRGGRNRVETVAATVAEGSRPALNGVATN